MSHSRKRSLREVSSAVGTTDQSQSQPSSSSSSYDGFVLGSRISSLPSLCLDAQRGSRKSSRGSSNNSSGSNHTLFGRVMMQQQPQPPPSHPPQPSSSKLLQTPTKQRRQPTNAASTASMLSPGGFNLRKAVDSALAASPLVCMTGRPTHDDDDDSHLVTPLRPMWRQADTLPTDWSLKERLILTSKLFESTPKSTWRWLQRNITSSTADDAWPQARTYWQYPSVGWFENSGTVTAVVAAATTTRPKSNDYSKLPPAASTSSRVTPPTASDVAWNQLQTATSFKVTSSRQQAWQLTFHSLYQSWRLSKDDTFYFYGHAADHTILFYYGDGQPQILLSSCDHIFRDWCQGQGVTLYVDKDLPERTRQPFVLNDWQVTNGTRPPPSPGSAAELAALRRAQVLKQTVGADVSIAVRSTVNNISQQRKTWQQIPPLRVVGVDDCAAVAEYYGNCRSTVTTSNDSVVPTLVAPQPFVGATQQMATIRWTATDTLEISGILLPSCVRQMWKALTTRLEAVADGISDSDTDDTWRVEATCVTARGPAPPVRPLEDAVVGQPCLVALQETNTTTTTTTVDVVSQMVWDLDEPNMVSYKVTPVA